ncbi:MAG: hypothetical protein NZ772_05645 [Cyanobacteria bacterium]|nr:hypothetical protein [Cyanobacteriota bacterium]MDW8201529.1 hypothetical protein [Cyanobacteriota bacterium SKYGB_h_bin112]
MRQPSSVVLLLLLAVATGFFSGCTIGDDTATAPSPSPTVPKRSPSPTPVAARPVLPNVNLVQPTNPEQRVPTIRRGRTETFNDPFNVVPVVPRLLPPLPSPSPGGNAQTPGGNAQTPGGNTQGNLPSIPNTPTATGPQAPVVPELPPLPEPTLAQAVEVTGIVQLQNGDFRIVLKAPQEQTPRYVRIGDRVSNGQVLVKRVETVGDTQVVVLEEVGVEVRRAVGEAAATSANAPSASVVLSLSQRTGNKI